MKYTLILFLCFLFGHKADGQVKLQTLINVYSKINLTQAKKSLQAIPGFQLMDSMNTDSLMGNIGDGNISAYVKHKKTNVKYSFTSEAIYKKLYKEAEQKFKYTTAYARGTGNRGNRTSRHTTSFSNYEGAKIGSLEVLLVVVSSTDSNAIVIYELLLFPYYED